LVIPSAINVTKPETIADPKEIFLFADKINKIAKSNQTKKDANSDIAKEKYAKVLKNTNNANNNGINTIKLKYTNTSLYNARGFVS